MNENGLIMDHRNGLRSEMLSVSGVRATSIAITLEVMAAAR